jgi:hypothetical protein
VKRIIARNIPDEVYFELKKVQAELKCRSWASTFKQLLEIYRGGGNEEKQDR